MAAHVRPVGARGCVGCAAPPRGRERPRRDPAGLGALPQLPLGAPPPTPLRQWGTAERGCLCRVRTTGRWGLSARFPAPLWGAGSGLARARVHLVEQMLVLPLHHRPLQLQAGRQLTVLDVEVTRQQPELLDGLPPLEPLVE